MYIVPQRNSDALESTLQGMRHEHGRELEKRRIAVDLQHHAEREAAEWKERFDTLLSKIQVATVAKPTELATEKRQCEMGDDGHAGEHHASPMAVTSGAIPNGDWHIPRRENED